LVRSEVYEALRRAGIERITAFQEEVARAVRTGRNCLVIAPTGTGKTEAVVAPVLESVLGKGEGGISLLYITPLRALNRDMLRRLEAICTHLGLRVAVRHGDTPRSQRVRMLTEVPDVLVTTPETLQIMLGGRRLRELLRHVRHVVVDEVHELVDTDRGAQLSVGLTRLDRLADGRVQRIALSATVGNPEAVAEYLGPDTMVVSSGEEKDVDVEVRYTPGADISTDVDAIHQLVKDTYSLIFVNTRDTAEVMGAAFRRLHPEFRVEVHHGSLSKERRIEAETRFKNREISALICTSSLELGIDIGHVELVVQYSSPRQVSRILQRVGRAGHGLGRVSRGVVLTSDPLEALEAIALKEALEEGWVEPSVPRENPLVVLANQITALALEGMSVEEAYCLLRGSSIFRKLSWQDFMDVAEELRRAGRISVWDGQLRARRGTHRYYYSSVSMIPDERVYTVVEISGRRPVGTIEEDFLFDVISRNVPFIMGARAWAVEDVLEGKVLVRPVAEGIVPSWSGQDIPVPHEIALRVGRKIRTGDVPDSIAREMALSGDSPNDIRITVEPHGTAVVVNAMFGSRVNETLEKLLWSVIYARTGEAVDTSSTPYSVVVQSPAGISAEAAASLLSSVPSEDVRRILTITLRNSTHVRWYFIHVAKKFGVLERDAEYSLREVDLLMRQHRTSAVMREAVDKMLWERMDIENTSGVLRAVADSEVEVAVTPPTYFGEKALERTLRTHTAVSTDSPLLDALRKRLEETAVRLVCLNCLTVQRVRPKDVDGPLRCPECGGEGIAPVREEELPLLRGARAGKVTPEARRLVERLQKGAMLIQGRPREALLVLAGRGVGVDTATRILSCRLEEREVLRRVLEAEVTYSRTKQFW